MTTLEPMRFGQTYEIVTDESAECGGAEYSGFDWQNQEYDFRGLVRMLEWHYMGAEPSDGGAAPRWITSYGERDMHDGSFRNISLHPANERAKRWWPKALRAAGIIR